MPKLKINGTEVRMPVGSTLLEAAQMLGIDIPTLCHYEGLSPYASCRLCMVELRTGGKSRLVTSCNHPVKEGLNIFTHTARVMRARRMLVELLAAQSPNSKTIQDLASDMGITKQRFKTRNETCILCGRCVRMCEEQMMSGAIGFVGRGPDRAVATPFRDSNPKCRNCGGCFYVCPVCELPCRGPREDGQLCNGCVKPVPSCTEYYDHTMCFMESTGCGYCVNVKSHGPTPDQPKEVF